MKELRWNEALTLLSPHPYCLASTIDENGRANLMGVGWWTIVSWSPRMIAFSVAKQRYTKKCLDHCPEFALIFPTPEQAKGAWVAGTVSGFQADKFEKGGFEQVPSKHIRPPLIKDCTLAFECKVVNRVECGDHFLYVGDILAIRGDPDRKLHLYTIHYSKPVAIDCDLNVLDGLKFR